MGMKKVYKCDICRDEKSPGQLIGCVFENMKDFKLGPATATDGTHICKDCLLILKREIPGVI